jgi:hypothetical protein
MAGLDPAIHVFDAAGLEDVDARHKPGMTNSVVISRGRLQPHAVEPVRGLDLDLAIHPAQRNAAIERAP